MKTTLSFGLMVAAASTLFACSDEGGVRPNGSGGTGAVTSQGGSGNTSGSGNGGSAQGGSGQGGSTASTNNYGPALTITGEGADVLVEDTLGMSGVNGGGSVSQSMIMEVDAVNTSRDGALCMTGTTAIVVGGDYTNAWGAQIVLDLNRVAPPLANPAPTDAGAVDAGGDGGGPVLGTAAQPWTPEEVLGFSFKIEGPTVATALSVNSSPSRSNPATDNFCYRRAIPPMSGEVIDVLFTDIRRNCWDGPPATASLFQDPGTDAMPYTQLQNFVWQINADTTTAHAFDFCISEIRPIIP